MLSYLHAKFLWFPLEPLSLFIATEGWDILTGIWIMFFVAWVLKHLALKIGGAKLYKNVDVPIATGFIAGLVTIGLFGGAGLNLGFFVPY